MFELIATICLWYTVASPDKPICFVNAEVLEMDFESESGCQLVRYDLMRALDADLRARQVGMGLVCQLKNKEQLDTTSLKRLGDELERIPDIIKDLDIHNR